MLKKTQFTLFMQCHKRKRNVSVEFSPENRSYMVWVPSASTPREIGHTKDLEICVEEIFQVCDQCTCFKAISLPWPLYSCSSWKLKDLNHCDSTLIFRYYQQNKQLGLAGWHSMQTRANLTKKKKKKGRHQANTVCFKHHLLAILPRESNREE